MIHRALTREVTSPNEDYLFDSREQPIHDFAVSIPLVMPVINAPGSS